MIDVISLLFATVGMYAGKFVPPVLMFPLAIAEFVMILAALLLRRSKSVGYTFVYVFTFLSGITIDGFWFDIRDICRHGLDRGRH